MLYGVDVSHHQGAIDWPAVARDGIGFAIVKATEGTGHTDSRLRANWAGAAAAGLARGAYHFLHPGNGAAQARHFLDALGDPGRSLLVVDAERTADGGVPGKADVAAFVGELRRRLGANRPVGIYTGWWYWNGVLDNPPLADQRVWLWESRYVAGSGGYRGLAGKVPAGWFGQTRSGGLRPALIQYSSTGRVAGVSGNCDVNLFDGTPTQLAALGGATQEWDEMATKEEIAAVVRAELNRGTGKGQRDWASTSRATLATMQALVNSVARLGEVDQAQLTAALAPALADHLVPQLVEAITALPEATPEAVEQAVRGVFADAADRG